MSRHPAPATAPPAWPVAGRRSRRGTFLFGGVYALMLIAGFAAGFRAGTSKPTPPAKATLLAKANTTTAKSDPTPTPQTEPAPKAKTPEPKKSEQKEPEPPPEKKPEPTPDPKTEPKTEPKKNPPPAKPGAEVAFAKVAQVFKDKCTICHGGVEPKGGLDLRSAKAAVAGGDSGEAVKPGDPDNSLLWQSIAEGKMPPKKKPQLTAEEKRLIKEWIADGAK
jgi:mono/diheme cytochrome c family protein